MRQTALLSAESKRKADLRDSCTVTINQIARLEMVMTAWVILGLAGDWAAYEGGPVLMRGNKVSTMSWVSRWGRQGINRPVYS